MNITSATRRRRSHEIRALILQAARELFEAQGYEATTTKDIAKRAGVLESLLFTNFGSKAELFDSSVIDPFADLVGDYVDAWNQRSADSTAEERISIFVDGLFVLAEQNKMLLRSAWGRRFAEPEGGEDLLERLAQVLHRVENIKALSEYPELDPPATMAVVTSTVFGMVLFGDSLFPRSSRRPGRARIVREMHEFVLHGLLHRGDQSSPFGTRKLD